MKAIVFIGITPFGYFYKTRLRGWLKGCMWILIYLVPLPYMVFNTEGNSWGFFIAAYFGINIAYECGYIVNDVFTTLKEENPTKRISEFERSELARNIWIVMAARGVLMALCVGWAWGSAGFVPAAMLVLALVCVLGIFCYYNAVRSRVNLYLIGPLNWLRFYGPVAVFWILRGDITPLFLTWLLYPLVKTLEFSLEPRFGVRWIPAWFQTVDSFRIVYYFIVACVLLGFAYFSGSDLWIGVVAVYYLMLRGGAYILYRRNRWIRGVVLSGSKATYRRRDR